MLRSSAFMVTASSAGAMLGSTSAGDPDRMSFGRPVLPPDVGAFHDDATASGNGASS